MRLRFRLAALAAILAVTGCATDPSRDRTERPPAEVRAQLVSLIPATVKDREGWATDIQRAFEHIDVPPSTENLCAALAVIAQESTFTAQPEVPNLAKIARGEIERRAKAKHVPMFVLDAALKLKSPDGRRYDERLARVRTEKELSDVFEDFIREVPLGGKLFGRANPVHTGGAMQVDIDFAKDYAKRHGYPYDDGSIREAVFTRRGGLYFGIAHLLDYENAYDRHLYRFADFNAGWHASRNAAFQNAVAIATGRKLALDGDLVFAKRGVVGETEAALRMLSPELGMSDGEIRASLQRGRDASFADTALYTRVFDIAERMQGRDLPRALVPNIRLESPKITRPLTTAWFANRVQTRYQDCVNRAFANLPKAVMR